MITWREEYVLPRNRVRVTTCDTNRSLLPGRILIVVKDRPTIGGEDNCIEASVEKLPIHLAILPEA